MSVNEENGHGINAEAIDIDRPWLPFRLDLDGKGRPHLNIDNMARILEADPALKDIAWYDTFHLRIFTGLAPGTASIPKDAQYSREWEDIDDLRITAYLQGEMKLPKVTDELIRKSVNYYSKLTTKNEAKEWMESLKWDGRPRINNFMSDALGAEHSIYMRAVSKNFWLTLTARIYSPGCKVDNMVVFEGPQGVGKSRALAAIGGKWYLDWCGDIYEKDFYLALQGKLVVEFSELDSFGKSDVTHIKSVISRRSDQYRSPYEARSISHPRQCVFVGSTNEPEWIKDQTGGRRFWPVKCDLIDVSYIEKHRDQLFAEAVARYKEQETWWEMPASTIAEQEARRQSDEWEPEVSGYLASQPLGGLSMSQIAEGALDIKPDKLDMRTQWRIGQCVRRSGWIKRPTKFGKLWYPKSIDTPSKPLQNSLGDAVSD